MLLRRMPPLPAARPRRGSVTLSPPGKCQLFGTHDGRRSAAPALWATCLRPQSRTRRGRDWRLQPGAAACALERVPGAALWLRPQECPRLSMSLSLLAASPLKRGVLEGERETEGAGMVQEENQEEEQGMEATPLCWARLWT